MTGDNVAVDEPTGRPIGAQLALLGERAVAVPGEATERVMFTEAPAAVFGAREWFRDWRYWRRCGAEHAEIDQDRARAARQELVLPRLEQRRKAAHERAHQRAWFSLLVVAGVVLALTVASVWGHWSWHEWRWGGPVLMLAQLAVGRYYRQARTLALVLMSTSWVWLPVFLVLGIEGWRWWPWWVAAGVALVACEQRGMRMAKQMPDGDGPGDHAHDGVSLPMLWERIQTRLEDEKVHAAHQHDRVLIVHGQEVGAAFGVTTREKVKDPHVEAVARAVHLGVKWVRYVHPVDEPIGEFVLFWRNPLEQVPPPPRYRFGDLSYLSSFSIGMDDGGAPDLLCIGYTSVLVFGVIGSGKSSVVRLVIVAVEAMPDADLWGVDTAGSSTLGAQRKRLGPGRVACGPQEVDAAVGILNTLLAEAGRRSSALDGGEDFDEDGEVDDRFRVADKPGRRGIVLVIGEYHDFCAHPELLTRLLRLVSVARKTAISIVVESPTLSKDVLGDGRELIRHMMVRVAMSCTLSDVVQGLGAGELERGWRADQLQPESEGKRNDAGVGYVWGGGRNRPRLTGFHPMPTAVAAQMREAIRPQRNHWYGLADDAPGDPRSVRPEGTSDDDEDVVDAVEVPEALVWLESAMGSTDRVTSDEAARVAGVSTQALAAALRPHGVTPEKWRAGDATERGYTRKSLVRALEALT